MSLPSVNLKNRWYFFVFTYVYVITLYILTNRLTVNTAHYLPLTLFDTRIPFIPWTAWIYVLVYISPLSVGFVVNRDQDVLPIVLSFIFMATVCTLVFIFYPTVYPRPHFVEGVSNSTWVINSLAVRMIHALDTPANCLPSQHVALGFLSAFYVQRYNRVLGNWFLILGILIAISTLTVKQHYLWDIVTGYFLARGTYLVARIKMDPIPAKAVR